jgi:multiple sugar transport system substrate-binding protein
MPYQRAQRQSAVNVRSLILLVLLGLPAVTLLAFGPRGQVNVPSGRVVVGYWEKWTGVEQQDVERLVNRFNTTVGAERGIWVDYNPVSNVDQRMLIATAGGDPPDLAGLYDYNIPQFADQDALLPLDELIREYGVDLAAFDPIWLEICRYQGVLYGLPSTPYTIALYYNRRLFREAGLDPDHPPETTAELADYAIRLTKYDSAGNITQLGFTESPAMLGWWAWIWPKFFGAQLWDGQAFHLATPEGRAAYHWIADLRVKFHPRAASAFEAAAGAIEGAQNPFLSERLAMVYQGPWVAKWITEYKPELDYAVAPFPSVTREQQHNFASTDVFVIPRGARHPREAMVFLAYLMRQNVLEELCKAHGKVSPFRTPGPDFFVNHPNPYIAVFNRMAGAAGAFGYPSMPMWEQARRRLEVLLDTVLQGDHDVDREIASTQQKIDAIVGEYEIMAAKRRGQ